MTRIAVLRALPGLGDLLCAVPALRALRAGRPDAHVDLIALDRTRDLWARFDELFDGFCAFPGADGLPEEPFDARRTDELFAQAPFYDEAFQLHGSGPQSTAFVTRLGAGRTYAPDPWREDRSEVLWPLDVLAQAGIGSAGTETSFPFDATSPIEGRYAVLHAGSALPDRRWPAERFAAVAETLAARGITPVLTGTKAEAEAVAAVKQVARTEVVDLIDRTPIDVLAALLHDAEAVVVNDTGVSHLAAAVGAPSVIAFMVTDPARWAPLDRERHVALVRPSVAEVLSALDRLPASAARSPGTRP